jgi:hypothetical protein
VVGDAWAVRITDVRLLAKRLERRPRLFEAATPATMSMTGLLAIPGMAVEPT